MGAFIKGAGRGGRGYLIVEPERLWLVAAMLCSHNHYDDHAAAECAVQQGAVSWPPSVNVPDLLERAGTDRLADAPGLGVEILTVARTDFAGEDRQDLAGQCSQLAKKAWDGGFTETACALSQASAFLLGVGIPERPPWATKLRWGGF